MHPFARKTLQTACLAMVLCLAGQAAAVDQPRIGFAELYRSIGVLGMAFSNKVLALTGKPVTMHGYMAPR